MASSSRSSLDSGSGRGTPVNGAGKMDYVYLKTILLQFLEQRDKKRQADLVKTVLGQLLHFDKYVPSSCYVLLTSIAYNHPGKIKRNGLLLSRQNNPKTVFSQ